LQTRQNIFLVFTIDYKRYLSANGWFALPLQTNIYNLNESPSSHKKKFNLKDGNTP
jgi:hypothetical protein